MQHVFLHGEAAQYVWKHFGGPLAIRTYNWWNQKSNNSIDKLVLQTIPGLICLEILKQRSECSNYGGLRNFNRYMMIQHIGCSIQSAIAKAYPKVGLTLLWITPCEAETFLKPFYCMLDVP